MALGTLLLAGCAAPIGANPVTTRSAYAQVEANALRTGKPSASTVSLLHRFDLDRLAARRPDEAVRQLHQKAEATGERDLLFALAELSYVAADDIRRSLKSGDPRDARDYYLGSAVYAWLYLFGAGNDSPPGAFDRRFRLACDLYNYGLGLALTGRRSTNAVVRLEDARRRLPVGEIDLRLGRSEMVSNILKSEQILLADRFRAHGLSARSRDAGLGTPLLGVWPTDPAWRIHRAIPATVLLRMGASLADFSSGRGVGTLEAYSPFADSHVTIRGTEVPLEADLTTSRAYTLNQSTVWKLGKLGFLAPAERIPSQLIANQPFQPDRIPVVFVHGTFSSPVTWAEMVNTLGADPILRRRCQVWSFVYGSGNPLWQSVTDLRSALTTEVQRLDPAGTNASLRRMVIIGHSQGGLLTKGTAVDTGDGLWRVFTTNRLEDLQVPDAQREDLRQFFFLKPLPFVRRVVFIATPHRGSYLSGSFVRRLAQRLVSLPAGVAARGRDMLELSEGADVGAFLQGKMPTSLDGMSPRNPGLAALITIPVAPPIRAHSIIPVEGDGDYLKGRDGVVSYQSAHLDGVDSELVVRSKHSCLNQPATIEEVRRILRAHLDETPP